jgi:hypothetical protein
MGGVAPPKTMAGMGMGPAYAVATEAAITTTATRLYYIPIYFPRDESWAGIKTYNGGSGDNGETYRVGVYEEGANGGPATLLVDCGEVTLNATWAVRTSASSFTVEEGWYYFAVHHNAATSMYGICNRQRVSGVAYAGALSSGGSMPQFNPPDNREVNVFPYVDTTYGALASSAVAPTASTQTAPSILAYKS